MGSGLPNLPERPPGAHKGDFGRVLVIAGSRGMLGAAELCCRAALKSGAGLLLAATPQECYPILATKLTCAMTQPVPQTKSGALALGGWHLLAELTAVHDAVAIGPGLGRHPSTQALVLRLLAEAAGPMVIDADALFAVASDPARLKDVRGGAIVTPHPGEMARLTGKPVSEVQADREAAAVEFATTTGAVVVFKGHGTVVTDGRRTQINRTGNPGMATAGAGDVLTGVIAALVGQGLELFDAARLGVHVHGLAGDIAAEGLGQVSVTAMDILNAVPAAFKRYAED